MPILVQLITESGEQVAAVNDVDGFISSCASEPRKWRLLKYVDPYGDTYFNRLQILDFLADWEAAETLVRSPEGETLWVEGRKTRSQVARGSPPVSQVSRGLIGRRNAGWASVPE